MRSRGLILAAAILAAQNVSEGTGDQVEGKTRRVQKMSRIYRPITLVFYWRKSDVCVRFRFREQKKKKDLSSTLLYFVLIHLSFYKSFTIGIFVYLCIEWSNHSSNTKSITFHCFCYFRRACKSSYGGRGITKQLSCKGSG
jgi:hypothetical protein